MVALLTLEESIVPYMYNFDIVEFYLSKFKSNYTDEEINKIEKLLKLKGEVLYETDI